MGQELSKIIHNEELYEYGTIGFSKKQVSLIKEYYYSITKDGKLDLPSFSELINVPKEYAKEIFEFIDISGTGVIEIYEFICALALFTQTPIDERLEALFFLFDNDKSRFLSKEEFKDIIIIFEYVKSQMILNSNDADEIIDKLFKEYFIKEEGINIEGFKQIILENKRFKEVLLTLNIISQKEFDSFFDKDIENEMNKNDDDKDDNYNDMRLGSQIKHNEEDGMFETENIEQGDQFMAIKPFEGVVKHTIPSNYKPSKDEGNVPEPYLELEYCYGYRCHDTRNNIKYYDSNNIIFHSAALIIKMDIKANTQIFNFENSDDITCLDYKNGIGVAGQMGAKPIINIFEGQNMATLAIIIGDLLKGIAHVALSDDCNLLVASAMNDDHDIAIYDISKVKNNQKPVLLVKSKGTRDVIMGIKFHPINKNQIVISSINEYILFEINGNKIKQSKGIWKTSTNKKPKCLSVSFNKNDTLIGLNCGGIGVFKGTSLNKILEAHSKFVYAFCSKPNYTGFFSGGGDGNIIEWSEGYQKLKTYNLVDMYDSINPKIRAIDINSSNNIIIGTRGGELIEISNNKANCILKGHYDFELWGLSTCNDSNYFYTIGMDFILAKWDINKRKSVEYTKLQYQGKVISISNNNLYLAIGCVNGYVIIMDPSNFKIISQIKSSRKEISELKFSPSSDYLAVGSHDAVIRIYETNNFKLKSSCKAHHSTITHFDFSECGQFLQSNCTSYEILYFNVQNGKQITKSSQFRDELWYSWTTTFGFYVNGIFPPATDGTDINSVDRSKSRKLLATGDDFGKVKLFNYPCYKKKSAFSKFIGHSSHVTNVRFNYNDNYIISTGGNDKSILQWKLIDPLKENDNNNLNEEVDYEEEIEDDELNTNNIIPVKEEKKPKQKSDNFFEEEDVETGDQALAVKPFLGELKHSMPNNLEKYVNSRPNGNLTPEYFHGFRCFDTRNSVRFDSEGKVVFISGCAGVTFDYKINKQNFFLEHDEDLISFDVYKERNIAATGQMAAKGRAKLIDIYVWDITSKEVLAHLKGFHLRAVNQLKFSPDGSKLLSFGQDDDNSLAVYDWENNRLIGSAKVDKSKVLGCCFMDNNNFISVGAKHIKIWKIEGSNIIGKKVSWGSNKQEPVFSCTSNNNNYFIGTSKGLIYSCNYGLSKGVIAHKDTVYVLSNIENSNKILSGGKDGSVIIWENKNGNITKLKELVTITNSLDPGIRAIDFDANNNKYLIGTKANELFIYENNTLNNIMNGHFDGELWGLCVSPNSSKYATCGGDLTVRLWDSIKLKQIKYLKLDTDARALDWASNDEFIICGDIKGKILLLDAATLTLKSQIQSSFNKVNQWIEDIKISPNCLYVAFGAHGGASKLEFMKIDNNSLKKGGTINIGLTSALIHLDWSVDNDILMVNSQAAELKFCSISAGKNVPSSSTKTQEYQTWTCKFGWAVQGIFKGVDYTDVNTVCRSYNKEIIATGDDSQLVNLYKYPSLDQNSKYISYKGHASHVTKVKFMLNDNKLISTGGNDKLNIVWKTDFGGECSIYDKEEKVHGIDLITVGIKKKLEKFKNEDNYGISKEAANYFSNNSLFEEEEVEDGDEFMAVKPWIGQMREPSYFKGPDANFDKEPEITVDLEYVYGYRSKDCRNNLFYTKNGIITYNAGALGICLDYLKNKQSYFNKHEDDVISIDYHKESNLIATGELGPKPLLAIWDADSKEPVTLIKGNGLIKGIQCIAFSPDGEKVSACCIDDNHMVLVYNVQNGQLLYSEKGDTAKILDICWVNNNEFCTVGIKHYKYWQIQNNSIKAIKGKFGNFNNKISCCKYDGKNILTGAVTGELQLWNQSSSIKQYKLHSGALDAIFIGKNNIFTGGKDKAINILSQQYSVTKKINLSEIISDSLSLKVRSICEDDNNKIIFGTWGSEIYTLNLSNTKEYKQIMSGHYSPNPNWTNEVWGLDVSPCNKYIYTVSDDVTLREWDINNMKLSRILRLDISAKGTILGKDPKTKDIHESAKLRSVCISPNGKLIVVGAKDGTLRVICRNKWNMIKYIKHRKSWIQEIRFSPDGTMFAVGSHDRIIDVYLTSNYKLKAKFTKHNSFITHIDWSCDSNYLHSTSGDYELLYWDVNSNSQITRGASALKDEIWHTWSCVLGWPVQGIFESNWDGTDVNMTDRSNYKVNGYNMIACSNDFSEIRIYKYPCLKKGSGHISLRGHCSHVTNVKWGINDERLFSTGGEDQCVMQWKVSKI